MAMGDFVVVFNLSLGFVLLPLAHRSQQRLQTSSPSCSARRRRSAKRCSKMKRRRKALSLFMAPCRRTIRLGCWRRFARAIHF